MKIIKNNKNVFFRYNQVSFKTKFQNWTNIHEASD